MKRLLMIAYYFPPIGGPGVYRSLKFCKYLPRYGWLPIVVAGGNDDPDFAPDETLLNEIPAGVGVQRIDYPHRTNWRRARAWLFDHRLGRLGHYLGFFFDLPCRFRQWANLALDQVIRNINQDKPEVIYTSAPPFSAHVVGLEIKKRFGIPWVADFRDPWINNPILMNNFPEWQLARHLLLERTVAKAASCCVFAHPLIAEEFAKRHHVPMSRVATRTNGYDPEDFDSVFLSPKKGMTSDKRVLVVHIGTFYGEYSPYPLRKALEMAASRRPDVLRQIKLVFVGGCPMEFSDLPFLEVEVLPRQSHAKAIQWLRESNVLLVVYPKLMGDYHIPGKLFEYVASGKPILAIVPPSGSAAEIVRSTGTGFVADPERPDEILDALEACLLAAGNRQDAFLPNMAAINIYSRLALTEKLADIFNQVSSTV
jgi:glycosyltransferase involved in cell wall biosynthesis